MFECSNPPPLVVLWRVLESCNLACPFCAYDTRLNFPRAEVSIDEVRRMITLMGDQQEAGGRPILLSWLGGEPTLWAHFAQATDQAARTGLRQSLTTNGTTLGSGALRQKLARQFDEVTISVDAIGQHHEDLRGWRGGFSKLATWVPKLATEARLAGRNLRVRANVVLMKDTLGTFAELCTILADWGVTQITFNQLGGRDRPEYFPQNRLSVADVAQLETLLPALRTRLAQRGVTVLGDEPYVGRIAESARDVSLKVTECQVARDFLFIDESGAIAPCAFVGSHFGVATGDIETAADLAAVPERLCHAQRRCPSDACDNCMSTQQFSKFAQEHDPGRTGGARIDGRASGLDQQLRKVS